MQWLITAGHCQGSHECAYWVKKMKTYAFHKKSSIVSPETESVLNLDVVLVVKLTCEVYLWTNCDGDFRCFHSGTYTGTKEQLVSEVVEMEGRGADKTPMLNNKLSQTLFCLDIWSFQTMSRGIIARAKLRKVQ